MYFNLEDAAASSSSTASRAVYSDNGKRGAEEAYENGFSGMERHSEDVGGRSSEDASCYTTCDANIQNISEIAAKLPRRKQFYRCICPCCGELKFLQHTFGPKITAVAIAACRDFAETFKHNSVNVGEGGNSFRVCAVCRTLAREALKVAVEKHPQCKSFTSIKRACPKRFGCDDNQPKIKLYSGSQSLV